MFNEGLIDPDFALMNFNQMYEKVAKGQIGTWAYNVNGKLNTGGPIDTMMRSFGAEVAVIEPFKNKEGITPKRGWSPAAGLYIMVPTSSKNVDAAIQYLNWMAVEENRKTITYGIKGVNWDEVDGAPVVKQDKPMIGANTDMSIFFPQWTYRDEAMEYAATISSDKTFGNLKVETLKLNRQHVYINPIFDRPGTASTDLAPTLNSKYQAIMIQSIMAKPSEFDKVYDGLLQEYMNIGGTKVMEEKVVAYRDMKAKNGNKPLTSGNPLIR
jgi:putative aldouronate transport system substrate-binding protein